MTRQWVCLQALDGNVFATALADTVDAIGHVFKRLLDLFEPKVFSIADTLRQAAINETGGSVDEVRQIFFRIVQTVKIAIRSARQILQFLFQPLFEIIQTSLIHLRDAL